MPRYLVATGIRVFPIDANNPRQAIAVLKTHISLRRYEEENPTIGMSLVEAHDRGALNYIVMDEARTKLLCGEFKGCFQQPVTRQLANALRVSLSDNLYFTTY